MLRKRTLSLEMIRHLHQRFGILAKVLIRSSKRRRAAWSSREKRAGV
jgi:hypothetical protein